MSHANHVLVAFLVLLGLYGMLAQSNLVRKLLAMNILQVAVIMFFISLAAKTGAQPPIAGDGPLVASAYVNPLPHALMLTAIVVGVATTGLASAFLIRIYRDYGTLEEADLLRRMRE